MLFSPCDPFPLCFIIFSPTLCHMPYPYSSSVRKLDLSHLCFSLNFYFLMFLSQFPSMFPLLTYSQLFLSLICQSPKTLKTKEKQDFNSTDTGNSLKVILRLRNPSRFPNQLVDPLVDLYQSLHSNSASTTSISPSISTTGASSILSTPRAPKKASSSSSERPILKWITNPDSKL